MEKTKTASTSFKDGVVSLVGFQSSFIHTIATLISSLLSEELGQRVHIVNAEKMQDYVQQTLKLAGKPYLLVTRRPEHNFCEAIIAANGPTVLVANDFSSEAKRITAERCELDGDIARELQHMATVFGLFNRHMKTLFLKPDNFLENPAEHLGHLSNFMGLDTGTTQIRKLISETGFPSMSVNQIELSDQLKVCISSIESQLTDNDKMMCACPDMMMLTGPDVTRKDNNIIDLTGRQGVVVYGPYVPLLPGRWMCRVVFAAAPNAVGETIRLTVHSLDYGMVHERGSVDYKLEKSGRNEITFQFEIQHIDQLVETVIQKPKAMFEGEIIFGFTLFDFISNTYEEHIDWKQSIEKIR